VAAGTIDADRHAFYAGLVAEDESARATAWTTP
jgi:hypothetical protein